MAMECRMKVVQWQWNVGDLHWIQLLTVHFLLLCPLECEHTPNRYSALLKKKR